MDQPKTSVKKTEEKGIGQLLIREGFISEADLEKALIIQKREKKDTEIPFETLLVKKDFLTEAQLSILKGHPDLKKEIAQMIVDYEIVDIDQVKTTLKSLKNHNMLGQTLIKKGLMNKDTLDELIQEQANALNIGELAVKLKMLREIDLVRALSYKNSQRTIGEILCSNDVIRPEDLSLALKKHNKREKIGEILIQQGMITRPQFQSIIKEQSQSKEKIGAFLIQKGLISSHQLYNAFSRQYNTPYMELDDFTYDELIKNKLIKFVSEKYARRNMVLPLTLTGKKLLIGITYPDIFQAV